MVVAADPADSAGNEVRVARIFILHEDAVPSEDRGGTMALDYFPVREVDLGKDPQTPNDSGDRVPGHLHDVGGLGVLFRGGSGSGFHLDDSLKGVCLSDSRGVQAALRVRLQPLP
jgi:hypothetical protein